MVARRVETGAVSLGNWVDPANSGRFCRQTLALAAVFTNNPCVIGSIFGTVSREIRPLAMSYFYVL